jgi:aerobic-type carbon monoxide dehydrogenase small subunit (CoxS/CutS family)
MIELTVNGEKRVFEGDPRTPLLWVIRDALNLKGTKFGCGIGQCGACSVHLNGNIMRSCMVPASAVAGMSVTTIEGLSVEGNHPVQLAWIEEAVPQCGYCQSGMIMAAVDLLQKKPQPSDDDINAAMTNLCRCGTYPRVRKAIHKAAESGIEYANG